ncbi:hypothetical protein GQ44DRAFT_754980 [Phaeosphaeriaceae sp. PMI808]|nr:hypothetical protein GQ44DRAFT_754980 [Phaeosphaeriaceae sp. PMI808]
MEHWPNHFPQNFAEWLSSADASSFQVSDNIALDLAPTPSSSAARSPANQDNGIEGNHVEHNSGHLDCSDYSSSFPWPHDTTDTDLELAIRTHGPQSCSISASYHSALQDHVALQDLEVYKLDSVPCKSEQQLIYQDESRHTLTQSNTCHDGNQSISCTSRRPRAKGHTLSIREWLQNNGLTVYPNRVQMERLAESEKITVKQARIKLNNLRARIKRDFVLKGRLGLNDHTSARSLTLAPETSTSQSLQISDPSYAISYLPNTEPQSYIHEICSPSNHSSFRMKNATSPPPSQAGQPIHTLPFPNHSSRIDITSVGRKGKRCYAQRHNPFDRAVSATSMHLNVGSDNRFACTSCPKSFRRAFDWQRHEEGAHKFNHLEWTCMFHHGLLVGTQCIFCSEAIDDVNHFAMEHNIHLCSATSYPTQPSDSAQPSKKRANHVCSNQAIADHTFIRKDLLVQHIRDIHLQSADETLRKTFKVPDEWSGSVGVENIDLDALWCGFCLESFPSIPDRMFHVASHFRDGLVIEDWVPRYTALEV